MITGLTGMGASRKTIPNLHNDVGDGWASALFSCIATCNPFEVRFVFDSNDAAWIDDIQAAPGAFTITFPLEAGYDTGAELAIPGGWTNFTFGAADIEGRIEGSATITPNGKPVFTEGDETEAP